MHHFDDGDLNDGVILAKKPPPLDAILGSWHIVWCAINGESRTMDYDDQETYSNMQMEIELIEPSEAKKKKTSVAKDANIALKLGSWKWDIEFAGRYDAEMETDLALKTSNKSLVHVDDAGVLAFCNVHDDDETPFLDFSLEAKPAGYKLGSYQSYEFVAKKTAIKGQTRLCLSKNEKVRLGYKWDESGKFENDEAAHRKAPSEAQPKDKGEQTYESILQRARHHTRERAKAFEELAAFKKKMESDEIEIGFSDGFNTSPANDGRAKQDQPERPKVTVDLSGEDSEPKNPSKRKISDEARSSESKARKGYNAERKNLTALQDWQASLWENPGKPRPDLNGEEFQMTDDEEPMDAEAGRKDDSHEQNGSETNGATAPRTKPGSMEPWRTNSGTGTGADDGIGRKKFCQSCVTQVLRRNWNIHTSSEKHRRSSQAPGQSLPLHSGSPTHPIHSGSPAQDRKSPAQDHPRPANDSGIPHEAYLPFSSSPPHSTPSFTNSLSPLADSHGKLRRPNTSRPSAKGEVERGRGTDPYDMPLGMADG